MTLIVSLEFFPIVESLDRAPFVIKGRISRMSLLSKISASDNSFLAAITISETWPLERVVLIFKLDRNTLPSFLEVMLDERLNSSSEMIEVAKVFVVPEFPPELLSLVVLPLDELLLESLPVSLVTSPQLFGRVNYEVIIRK